MCGFEGKKDLHDTSLPLLLSILDQQMHSNCLDWSFVRFPNPRRLYHTQNLNRMQIIVSQGIVGSRLYKHASHLCGHRVVNVHEFKIALEWMDRWSCIEVLLQITVDGFSTNR